MFMDAIFSTLAENLWDSKLLLNQADLAFVKLYCEQIKNALVYAT